MTRRQSLFNLFQCNTGRTVMPMPKIKVPTVDLRNLTGYQPPLMRKYWK